jgi:ATP-dependent Lon protease
MKSCKFLGEVPTAVPILPLRDMVVFPNVMIPLFLKGSRVVKLAESVVGVDNLVGLFYQKGRNRADSPREEISTVGTLARIQQVVRLESGGVKAVADGMCRIRLNRQVQFEPYVVGEISVIEEESESTDLMETLVRSVSGLFKVALFAGRPISEHAIARIERADTPGKLADLIAVYLPMKAAVKQTLLETEDPVVRLRQVFPYLLREVDSLQPRIEASDGSDSAGLMARRQKEHSIRQQVRSLQRDMNSQDDPQVAEIRDFEKRIRNCGMPDDAIEVATRELQRLERIPTHSPEYTVSRTYLEVLTGLPWTTATVDNVDIKRAESILEEDHHALEKVKERILEFLAVHKLKQTDKGPILCLVGPPGVGKTSLGKSIARSLGRNFIRISLGGMRDEAEIRGHRRTYIGAMPGRVIQEIRRAGSRNPVFMLDEVDKIGHDFRGDPASALLEVLDPEQNNTFVDHYLDVPFDLSKVMFIATANQLDPIPAPLRDRMEVIRIPGYTDEEKAEIGEVFLAPKCLDDNGLKDHPIKFTSEAIGQIVRSYTREAGVRDLERQINGVCRKIAREITQDLPTRGTVFPKTVEELLGPPRFHREIAEEEDQVGIATGLAWTETGGDIIFVEVTGFKGTGSKDPLMTGSLGDVMRESAKAAISYLRHTSHLYGVDEATISGTDLHIHVPAGAIPKDGPSAGITLVLALASFFMEVPVRREVAMTGEITLRGRVLPIGGVKEKLLAARRAGVREVILPAKNEPSLRDLPAYVMQDMKIHFVNQVEEAIRIALASDADAVGSSASFPEEPIVPPMFGGKRSAEYAFKTPGEGE